MLIHSGPEPALAEGTPAPPRFLATAQRNTKMADVAVSPETPMAFPSQPASAGTTAQTERNFNAREEFIVNVVIYGASALLILVSALF